MFAGKPTSLPLDRSPRKGLRLGPQTLPTNIWLGLKWISMTNALAYNTQILIDKVKSLIVQAQEQNWVIFIKLIKKFLRTILGQGCAILKVVLTFEVSLM
jgi:hypothetical protein